MGNFALKMSTVVIIVLVAIIIYLRECTSPEASVPDGYLLVHDSTMEAFTAAANRPADTVFRDTGSYHISLQYRDRPIPIPVELEPEHNLYQDSIKSDTFNFWIEATVNGTLDRWSWAFDITRLEITNTVEIPAPYPVDIPVPVSKAGWYGSLGLGGTHTGKMGAGPRLDLITKQDRLYGVAYTRIGSDNFYEFRFGTRIKRK